MLLAIFQTGERCDSSACDQATHEPVLRRTKLLTANEDQLPGYLGSLSQPSPPIVDG